MLGTTCISSSAISISWDCKSRWDDLTGLHKIVTHPLITHDINVYHVQHLLVKPWLTFEVQNLDLYEPLNMSLTVGRKEIGGQWLYHSGLAQVTGCTCHSSTSASPRRFESPSNLRVETLVLLWQVAPLHLMGAQEGMPTPENDHHLLVNSSLGARWFH